MNLSRRDFGRLAAGAGALAALGQLGRSASLAQTGGYKAMVGVFLLGGADGWNMIVPTDARYAAYAALRGPGIALAQGALMSLPGTPFGLHPSFAPLQGAWNDGALGAVLNTGPLVQPLTRDLYNSQPDLRPSNLMSHADQQVAWQGMRPQAASADGVFGRLQDRMGSTAMVPPLISFAGANLALIGQQTSPLILPQGGALSRNGYNASSANAAIRARQAASAALADGSAFGPETSLTAQQISTAYDQAAAVNSVISAATSAVDPFFVDPSGAALTSDIAAQLLRTARMIAARSTFGHAKQVFFVSQGGHDTHAGQVDPGSTATGTQADLYTDLAQALAAFYNAMKALGLSSSVTTFTMSDFGRVYKANAQLGTDHAWGSNHLVMGGGLAPRTVHGAYPDQVLGGRQDVNTDGRWIPTTALEEYMGAIAGWFGVAPADMAYVFPNWATWSSGGRGPLPLFA
jgi:uncharacterized protein (DUF1501 family)